MAKKNYFLLFSSSHVMADDEFKECMINFFNSSFVRTVFSNPKMNFIWDFQLVEAKNCEGLSHINLERLNHEEKESSESGNKS